MIGAILLHEIWHFFVLEISKCTHAHRVAEELHASVHITLHAHITHHRAYQAEAGIYVVGQNRTVALGELSAHPHHVFGLVVGHNYALRQRCKPRVGVEISRNGIHGLSVFSDFMRCISRNTEFCPVVRTFEHINAECIGKFPHSGIVVRSIGA